jgi:hypothetical protein
MTPGKILVRKSQNSGTNPALKVIPDCSYPGRACKGGQFLMLNPPSEHEGVPGQTESKLTGESGGESYIRAARTIVMAALGPTLVSAVALGTIGTVILKHLIPGSTWMYSAISSVLLLVGTGLSLLATAVVLRSASEKTQ